MVKNLDTTCFSRVVLQFQPSQGLVNPLTDTTDFSRLELQLRPLGEEKWQKLKLHPTKVGGIFPSFVQLLTRLKLKDHPAEAGGI